MEALRHKIGKLTKDDKGEFICDEKGNYINEKLGVCSSKLKDIGETSLGIELYFRWLKHFGITFLIMSIFSILLAYKNFSSERLVYNDFGVFSLAKTTVANTEFNTIDGRMINWKALDNVPQKILTQWVFVYVTTYFI